MLIKSIEIQLFIIENYKLNNIFKIDIINFNNLVLIIS